MPLPGCLPPNPPIYFCVTSHGSEFSTLLKSTDPRGFYTNPNTEGGKWLAPRAYSKFIVVDLPVRQTAGCDWTASSHGNDTLEPAGPHSDRSAITSIRLTRMSYL